MNKNNLNIAVLGMGYMGQNHMRVLSAFPHINLSAVCDIDPERLEKISRQYKTKAYQNYKQLIDQEDLDIIIICLPTMLHFSACRYAIKNKIKVFLEKPISRTVQEAKKLINFSKATKIPIMVGHIERFNPVVNEIKKRIKTGELGEILQIHTQRFSPPPNSNQNVSVTIDLATHDIDVISYLLEQKPQRIFSESINKLDGQCYLLSALLRFKDGVIGQVEVSWLYPNKKRSLTILGEKGMYIANYITQELFFFRQNEGLFKGESMYLNTKADVVKIAFKSREPLQIELEAFIKAIREGRGMPVNADDGLSALEIAYKMETSGIKHEVVK